MKSIFRNLRIAKFRRRSLNTRVGKLMITSIVIFSFYFVHYVVLLRIDAVGVDIYSEVISRPSEEHKQIILDPECPVLRYNPSIPLLSEGCRRIKPVNGSCQLAQELFFSEPTATCQHQLKTNICQISESGSNVDIECFDNVCADETLISLGGINRVTGGLNWQRFSSIQDLETYMKVLLEKKIDDHLGFRFIKCAIGRGNNKTVQQLLVLPPFISPNKNSDSQSKININLVLIDSVSHSHFLRSMPMTLKTLRAVQESSVLNFELFQSLKGRTNENLQALFSGMLYDTSIHPERLLAGFKKKGYETMITEDLCWMEEHGMLDKLGPPVPLGQRKSIYYIKWKNLKRNLKKARIDRIEFSLASCEILKSINNNRPFFGPPAICYNGQYQHEYILDYLSKRQKCLEANRQPFFHSTLLNVAHDDRGRRLQTLDGSFAEYVEVVSKLKNTLTIIFSDHGNTYGRYVERSKEAKVEMFHPVLFMIVPPSIAKTLGEQRMDALEVNQQRLVSILDIHYALRVLSEGKVGKLDKEHQKYSIKADGIFSVIASDRTCSDIPRIEPNICICQDYEHDAINDARYTVMAEFAIDTLNKEIQQQFQTSNPNTDEKFGSCQRLVADHLGSIKETFHKNGDHEVKMDIHIQNPDNSSLTEIFMVTVKVTRRDGEGIQFVAYERITPYSPFEKCADKGVPMKLCVCSLSARQTKNQ